MITGHGYITCSCASVPLGYSNRSPVLCNSPTHHGWDCVTGSNCPTPTYFRPSRTYRRRMGLVRPASHSSRSLVVVDVRMRMPTAEVWRDAGVAILPHPARPKVALNEHQHNPASVCNHPSPVGAPRKPAGWRSQDDASNPLMAGCGLLWERQWTRWRHATATGDRGRPAL